MAQIGPNEVQGSMRRPGHRPRESPSFECELQLKDAPRGSISPLQPERSARRSDHRKHIRRSSCAFRVGTSPRNIAAPARRTPYRGQAASVQTIRGLRAPSTAAAKPSTAVSHAGHTPVLSQCWCHQRSLHEGEKLQHVINPLIPVCPVPDGATGCHTMDARHGRSL